MSRTVINTCDRCGQYPLADDKCETLSLSPRLAKGVIGAEGRHMIDLCVKCAADFDRFMSRQLG